MHYLTPAASVLATAGAGQKIYCGVGVGARGAGVIFFLVETGTLREIAPVSTNTATTMSLTNASPLEAAQAARKASRSLAVLSAKDRNDALTAMHDALLQAKDEVLAANKQDLEAATKAAQNGDLSRSLVKRLDLGRAGKYDDMLQGILDVRELPDPSMSCIPVLGN
jgi:hypothetical protein